jgi:hypothetical protein
VSPGHKSESCQLLCRSTNFLRPIRKRWQLHLQPVEVGRVWVRTRRLGLGSGFLHNKTPSPAFFIHVVKPKPKPDLSPTYLVHFSSSKNLEPAIWIPCPTRTRNNQTRPTSINLCLLKTWPLVAALWSKMSIGGETEPFVWKTETFFALEKNQTLSPLLITFH